MTEQKSPRFVMPYTLESAVGAFENALADCRKQGLRPKVANYDEWLSNLWDCVKQSKNEKMQFYPTNVQMPLEDSYPEGMEPWTEEFGQSEPNKPKPCPLIHNPLEERLDEILEKAGIKDIESNYFIIGNGVACDSAFAKVYCCLTTKKAMEFAEELSEYVKINKSDFQGKFWGLGGGSHNGLVLYVPFHNLSKIADWLATKREYFHPVELNHPVGVELFPGISAVIAKENAAFDGPMSNLLDSISDEAGNNKCAFMKTAKERLEQHKDLDYHFKWLKDHQEPKFAGFPPPPKAGVN